MASRDKECPPGEKLDEKKKDNCPPGQRIGVPGKTSWPELVGTKGEDAVAIIMKENPNVNAIIVKEPHVTADYSPHRVRVFVDECGIVNQVPVVG